MRYKDSQTCYQRNLLRANAVTAAIVMVAALLIVFFDPNGSVDTPPLRPSDFITTRAERPTEGAPGRGRGRGHPATSSPRSGYLGRRINIIPDQSEPEVSIARYAVEIETPVPSVEPLYVDSSLDFYGAGPDEYGDAGAFGTGGLGGFGCFRRPATVVYSPAPQYPLVALQSGIEGEAVVLVYVDSLGVRAPFQVTHDSEGGLRVAGDSNADLWYLVLREEPSDWFFADKLIQMLPHWRFSPAVVNGQPTGAFMEITYRFRLHELTGL